MKLSRPRVILGGLMAGIVVNSSEYLLDSFVLANRWGDAFKAFNSPYFTATTLIAALQIVGFVSGVLAVRRYAVSSSDGTGRKKAMPAALFAWLFTYVPLCAILKFLKLIPYFLAGTVAVSSLCGLAAGALLGCWIFDESQAAARRKPSASHQIQEA